MTAASQPDFVDLRIAAFGTLSNGSDVRLLARPVDGDLSEDAKATIEAVFYAAWKAVGTRRAPYFLFTQLDNKLWGLCLVRQLGRGAIGEVLVVWVALLDIDQLDSIEWATHRLLYTAFPDAGSLPTPNSRLPTHRAQVLRDQSPEVQAYDPAFDQLAFRLVPDLSRIAGWRAHVSVEPPADASLAPLSPEGVLFGLFDRLGRWRSDLSYCTWAGFETFGFPRTGEAFNLVLSEAPADTTTGPAGRIVLKLGAATEMPDLPAPRPHWLAAREDETGVREVGRGQSRLQPSPSSATDDAELADRMFDAFREQLLGANPSGPFLQLAGGLVPSRTTASEVRAKVLPLLLSRTLDERRGTYASKAKVVDRYIDDILPSLETAFPAHWHRRRTAQVVIELNLLAYLSPTSIDNLASEIFGDINDPGLTEDVATLARASATDTFADWTPVLQRLLRHADGPGRRSLLPLLIAQAFGQPKQRAIAEEALVQLTLSRGLLAGLSVLNASDDIATRRAIFVQLAKRGPRPSRMSSPHYFTDRLVQTQLLNAGRHLAQPERKRDDPRA